MPRFDASKAQTPALGESPMRRVNPRGGAPKASFVSQMLADHSSPAEDTHPMGEALRTYAAGTRISVRRMPAGYRMKLDA